MIVDTQVARFESIALESGATLSPVEIAYETYGDAERRAIERHPDLHAFSGDAHAAGIGRENGKPGWWDNMIGPGKAFDTDKYFIICSNVLGGCQGTTGPASINPATGAPYAMSFPVITIARHGAAAEDADRSPGHRETARGRGRLHGRHAGAAMGRVLPADDARRVIPIATTARHSAQQIAFNEVGTPVHHGRSRLVRRQLLRQEAARAAASPSPAWSATSPT